MAALMQLRYMYAMPMERIIHYFEDMGFNLNKKTASFLMKRAAEVFARFYEAIRQAVLGEDYIAADPRVLGRVRGRGQHCARPRRKD